MRWYFRYAPSVILFFGPITVIHEVMAFADVYDSIIVFVKRQLFRNSTHCV
jgi:hypothetical protein